MGNGEEELRGLLREAMAGPDQPLSAAQVTQILRSVPQDRPIWALGAAAVCLTVVIGGALSGAVPPQVRGLLVAATVGNLALSPLAALALVWRRRVQNAI